MPKIKRNINKHLEQYREGKSIVMISTSANFPPFLMARQFVREIFPEFNRKDVSMLMRHPDLLMSEGSSFRNFHKEPMDTGQRYEACMNQFGKK
eukprot:scaffold11525_cov135-Cylindrotheca_fusiformis.AAC.6